MTFNMESFGESRSGRPARIGARGGSLASGARKKRGAGERYRPVRWVLLLLGCDRWVRRLACGAGVDLSLRSETLPRWNAGGLVKLSTLLIHRPRGRRNQYHTKKRRLSRVMLNILGTTINSRPPTTRARSNSEILRLIKYARSPRGAGGEFSSQKTGRVFG